MASVVYINDNPIGETEVYHARKSHVSTRPRIRDRYLRETTAEKAREDGYRPCQQCFPDSAAESCPACGFGGGEGTAPGVLSCGNGECRVMAFEGEAED